MFSLGINGSRGKPDNVKKKYLSALGIGKILGSFHRIRH